MSFVRTYNVGLNNNQNNQQNQNNNQVLCCSLCESTSRITHRQQTQAIIQKQHKHNIEAGSN